MSDYKRWISYIYYYDNGEKKNNIGYARVETRGSKTKITVHINVLSVAKPMNTYLFIRKDDRLEGINIGQIVMDKGVGHGVFNVDTYNIGNSGHGIGEMGGIIIMFEKEKFYASEWDDSPIIIDNFIEWTSEMKPEITEPEFNESHGADTEDSVSEITETDIRNSEANEPENMEADTGNQENGVSDNTRPVSLGLEITETEDSESEITENENTEPDPSALMYEPQRENQQTLLQKTAERMLESYPSMYPFEDDEMIKCVRIEPQDIGQLPVDTWVLANNSFLLHGYYGYRHLILMKTADEDNPQYVLGVPGIYHNRDNFMAGMFGFNSFKPMKNTDEVKGELGYWCVLLSEIPEVKKYI